MGTRACVAVGNLEKWVGLYSHWDGYPSGLGQDVWTHIQGLLKGKRKQAKEVLEGFAQSLLQFDDWRAYCNKGVCPYS